MRYLGLVLAAATLLPVPAQAQTARSPDEIDARVGQMLETSKQAYSPLKPVTRCDQSNPNEIVVCVDRVTDQGVSSTAETDPNSLAARRARDGNIPSAPFVGTIRCRQGADGVCRGNVGQAPAPAYYVDVSALPQAPEGSDADKIAKGEMAAP